jgi:hypothetical protein
LHFITSKNILNNTCCCKNCIIYPITKYYMMGLFWFLLHTKYSLQFTFDTDMDQHDIYSPSCKAKIQYQTSSKYF